jgi:hypothetical protein
MTIKASPEDFREIFKVLPQSMEISMLRQPKCLIAMDTSITAMVPLSTPTITQLNAKRATLTYS